MAVLKKAVKKKWVEALRSGKYEQGRNALNEGGEYCCLGVLCEVAIESGLDLSRVAHRDAYVTYDGHATYPPRDVKNWAKLKKVADDPFYTSRGSLASLNDVEKLTFAEIADIIEKEL